MIVEKLFSDFKWENWRNLILFSISIFLFLQLGFIFVEGRFPVEYGEDYLAFWSAGKIANENSYSEIYDLNYLRSVQTQELKKLGYLVQIDDPSVPPNPAPILPIFIFPFQILSKTPSNSGYWIWTIINLAGLVGYLLFFLRKISAGVTRLLADKNILPILLIFFPVFLTWSKGRLMHSWWFVQVNLFAVQSLKNQFALECGWQGCS